MKKGIVFIVGCTLGTAAAAWAGDIPKALDEGVLRLGPLLSGALERTGAEWWEERTTSGGGGGAYFWAQYDGSWFAYEARLGAVGVGGDGDWDIIIDWENEYCMYLIEGKYRPYVALGAGLRRAERRVGETTGIFGFYFGVRLNSPVSPFYMTFGGGYKYAEYSYGVIHNRYYFGLSTTVAFRVELEAGSEFTSGKGAFFGRLNAGPSFSF